MRSRRAMVLVLGAVLAVAAACSRKPASIQIKVETPGKGPRSKDVKIYGIDRSQRLTAQVLDKNGKAFEQATATWSASNANVKAEPGGRIVAQKPGKAMVTATYEGVSAQIPVEVVDVSTIEISPISLALTGPAGTAIPVTWTVKDSKQKPVDLKPEWSSANSKIATVTDGVVTSVAPGTTTIVARIGDIQGGSDVTVVLRPIARIEDPARHGALPRRREPALRSQGVRTGRRPDPRGRGRLHLLQPRRRHGGFGRRGRGPRDRRHEDPRGARGPGGGSDAAGELA